MDDLMSILPIFLIVPIAIVIGVVVFILRFMKEKRRLAESQRAASEKIQARQSSASASKSSGMTDEQRRRLDYLREQQKQKAEQHERHQADAHEHGHEGEEEHYEEIVGSLGDVNDEGCADLSGVRFIAHDLAYDTSDKGKHDYAQLAKAIVMGEIVNNPRFKQPYHRK